MIYGESINLGYISQDSDLLSSTGVRVVTSNKHGVCTVALPHIMEDSKGEVVRCLAQVDGVESVA